MRGILAGGTGQLRWQDVPDVVVGPAEVLIDVHTAGVNRADLLQAAGKYPPPPGASDVLGLEVSGTVAEVGVDVGGFVAGQRQIARDGEEDDRARCEPAVEHAGDGLLPRAKPARQRGHGGERDGEDEEHARLRRVQSRGEPCGAGDDRQRRHMGQRRRDPA